MSAATPRDQAARHARPTFWTGWNDLRCRAAQNQQYQSPDGISDELSTWDQVIFSMKTNAFLAMVFKLKCSACNPHASDELSTTLHITWLWTRPVEKRLAVLQLCACVCHQSLTVTCTPEVKRCRTSFTADQLTSPSTSSAHSIVLIHALSTPFMTCMLHLDLSTYSKPPCYCMHAVFTALSPQ